METICSSCGFPQSFPIPHEHDRTEREKEIIAHYDRIIETMRRFDPDRYYNNEAEKSIRKITKLVKNGELLETDNYYDNGEYTPSQLKRLANRGSAVMYLQTIEPESATERLLYEIGRLDGCISTVIDFSGKESIRLYY